MCGSPSLTMCVDLTGQTRSANLYEVVQRFRSCQLPHCRGGVLGTRILKPLAGLVHVQYSTHKSWAVIAGSRLPHDAPNCYLCEPSARLSDARRTSLPRRELGHLLVNLGTLPASPTIRTQRDGVYRKPVEQYVAQYQAAAELTGRNDTKPARVNDEQIFMMLLMHLSNHFTPAPPGTPESDVAPCPRAPDQRADRERTHSPGPLVLSNLRLFPPFAHLDCHLRLPLPLALFHPTLAQTHFSTSNHAILGTPPAA